MLKTGIKNYFINFKYLFTSIGTLAIGIVLGLSILIPGVINAVGNLATETAEITSNTNIDFSVLWNCINNAVGKLDWSSPVTAIATIFDGDWLTATFNSCIDSLVAESGVYIEQITAAINVSIAHIVNCFTVTVIFIILGLMGGFFLLKFLVRRTTARRSLWKLVLAWLTDSVLSVGLMITALVIGVLWKPSVFISAVVSIILVALYSLLEAYLIHGYKKVDIKSVINIKNVGLLWLTNLIVFGVTCLFSLILILINTVAGLLIAMALFEIMFLVASLNSEAYVLNMVKEKSQTESIEKE